MRSNITPDIIANQVLMVASHHKGAFLLVEGDTDARVFQGFVDRSTCMVIPGHNKDNVIQAVELILNRGLHRIAAIVDSDYWLLSAVTPSRDCVFVTDSHDLETMMLQTAAFDKVLRELASRQKLEAFEKSTQRTILETLLDAGMPIGLARWLSERDGLALRFRDMDFSLFIEAKLLTVDIERLVNTILGNTVSPNISNMDLRDRISKELNNTRFHRWHICSGHDIMNILSIGLQRTIGNRKPNEVTRDVLERHFRLAYEYEFFQMSQLWKSLRAWEAKNPAYKLFRA